MFVQTSSSQCVRWQEEPKWDSTRMLGSKLLCVEQSGKWGVVSFDGTQIIPCDYAKITELREGRFLVVNENNKIISLHNENGNSFPINKDCFVDNYSPYFFNNRLAIHDSQNHWGYLDKSGKIVIELNNEFAYACPFSNNLAAVQYNDKNKSWGYIYSDGSPLKYENSKISNGYKDISFASSFTEIDGSPVALIRLYGTLFMIDQYGNILSHILPKKGVPINVLHITPNVPVSSGIYTFVFNEKGEISSLKKSSEEYNNKNITTIQSAFPTIETVLIDNDEIINVGKIKISSQFQDVIPLTTNYILVKKEGKWGILFVDSNLEMPNLIIESQSNHQAYRKTILLRITNTTDKTKIYAFDTTGNRHNIDIIDGKVSIPTEFVNKEKKMRLCFEIDGILLEPYDFSVNIPEKKTNNPSPNNDKKLIKVELISSKKMAVFKIQVNRNDWKDCRIIINNGERQRVYSKGEEIYKSGILNFNNRSTLNIPVKIEDASGRIIYNRLFEVKKM